MGAGASAGGSGLTATIDECFAEPSDAFVTVALLTVPAGHTAHRAVVAGHWQDQGWGNQKGRVRLALLKGGEELASQALEGVAPHEAAAFSLELDAAAVAGAQHVRGAADAVAVQVVVGGGGGHELTLHQTSAALEVDAAADAAPAAPADVARIARAWAESGDASLGGDLPARLASSAVVEAFGPELLDLMTGRVSTQEAAKESFAKAHVADAFLRMRKFYRWVMTNYGDRPFFEADYDKVCEETSTTTEIIIGLLVDEFGKLVDCDSPEVIRKVVALDQLKDGEFRGLDAADLERIPDQREFEREAANLVVQMWADTKRVGGWGDADPFLPSSLKHARHCRAALQSGDPDSVVTVHDRDRQIFLELKAWMEARAGLAEDALGCSSERVVNYKPLQSLFNKAYVRRGQMSSAQIAGDIRRCTFTVETVEELERLTTMLEGAFPENYAQKVDKWKGTVSSQLAAIAAMKPLELTTADVTIYRFKANSSQAGRDRCELYNMNFFLDHPNYYQAGLASAYLCACEVQIGVASTVAGLRQNHTPYERQRILDALPLLGAYNDGRCGAGASPDAAYGELSAALFQRAFPRVDRGGVAVVEDRVAPVSWTGDRKISGVIINDANFKAWCEPMNQILWSGDVDPDAVQNVESLFVDVQDQGWGGEGLLVALVVELGPYLVCLASRGYNRKERQLRDEGQPGIYLVDETGYNFSGFSDKTVVPRGASRLHVVACGRLTDYGHSFTYCGLRMRLATLKAPEA